MRDDRHATQDERAHEDLAQLAVLLHQVLQHAALDLDQLAVVEHAAADQAAPPGHRLAVIAAHLEGGRWATQAPRASPPLPERAATIPGARLERCSW